MGGEQRGGRAALWVHGVATTSLCYTVELGTRVAGPMGSDQQDRDTEVAWVCAALDVCIHIPPFSVPTPSLSPAICAGLATPRLGTLIQDPVNLPNLVGKSSSVFDALLELGLCSVSRRFARVTNAAATMGGGLGSELFVSRHLSSFQDRGKGCRQLSILGDMRHAGPAPRTLTRVPRER